MTTTTTAVTHSVTLGVAGYGASLTITSTGSIDAAAIGATALYAPSALGSVRVTNKGGITGGLGATAQYLGGAGGLGADLEGGGRLTNSGTITGGTGGTGGC